MFKFFIKIKHDFLLVNIEWQLLNIGTYYMLYMTIVFNP